MECGIFDHCCSLLILRITSALRVFSDTYSMRHSSRPQNTAPTQAHCLFWRFGSRQHIGKRTTGGKFGALTCVITAGQKEVHELTESIAYVSFPHECIMTAAVISDVMALDAKSPMSYRTGRDVHTRPQIASRFHDAKCAEATKRIMWM